MGVVVEKAFLVVVVEVKTLAAVARAVRAEAPVRGEAKGQEEKAKERNSLILK